MKQIIQKYNEFNTIMNNFDYVGLVQVRDLFAVVETLAEGEDKTDGAGGSSSSGAPSNTRKGSLLAPLPQIIDKNISYIEFNASQVAVLEKSRRVNVLLRRKGDLDAEVSVRIETIDGTHYYKRLY